jgi:hypothetical protein
VLTYFLLSLAACIALLTNSQAAMAQATPTPPSFYTTYTYTAYTVYDTASAGPPTRVSGVGGTLTLRPNGTYEKRLSIVAAGTPHYFNQTGTFTLAGDSIRFAFSDLKGADVQRGTFRFVPATRRLSVTILGYPPGNKGVYELVASPPMSHAKAPKARAKAPVRPK